MAVRTVVHVPGGLTVVDVTTTTGPDPQPPVVVGSAPQWDDDSDATYAELETYESIDVSYADSAQGVLAETPVTTSTSVGVYARVRYSALAENMKPPQILVTHSSGTLLSLSPTGAAAGSATTVEYELAEGIVDGKRIFLDRMNGLGEGDVFLVVQGPYLNNTNYRNVRTRVFEACLIVGDPITEAPPCRLFPREDGMGVGSGRHYPRAKSQQRSPRRVGHY